MRRRARRDAERERAELADSEALMWDFMGLLRDMTVTAMQARLVGSGMCLPPSVQVVCSDLDPPLVAMAAARPMYRGADAGTAVAGLGLLPAAMCATHLVVSWDHADLLTALDLPVGSDAAVVVVMASLTEHVVHWHPYSQQVGAVAVTGLPSVTPGWEPPQQFPGATLPEPVARLLARWRDWRSAPSPEVAMTLMKAEGYGVELVAR